ncbi:NYN domain-containing protein [Enterovibrio nigricans]|nr:NYN domain-containing protein [Enterovibrio nigricans]
MKKVAVLVDGDFFLRTFTRAIDPERSMDSGTMAKLMWRYWVCHVDKKQHEELHRIYFYDCPPLTKKIHHPTSGEFVDLGSTPIAKFRSELHQNLIKFPFVARRMGFLDEGNARWVVRSNDLHKKLIKGSISASEISPDQITYHAGQKGVDMKIGLDIATLVLKDQVQKIVLISGDSDFVPAAKLARTEGAHFVLDAMNASIRDDLAEHIDQLRTHIKWFSEKHAETA